MLCWYAKCRQMFGLVQLPFQVLQITETISYTQQKLSWLTTEPSTSIKNAVFKYKYYLYQYYYTTYNRSDASYFSLVYLLNTAQVVYLKIGFPSYSCFLVTQCRLEHGITLFNSESTQCRVLRVHEQLCIKVFQLTDILDIQEMLIMNVSFRLQHNKEINKFIYINIFNAFLKLRFVTGILRMKEIEVEVLALEKILGKDKP